MKSVGLTTQEWCQKHQIPVQFFSSVESTSSYAKTLLNDPLENHKTLHVVLADSQTAGRGRGTNSWMNPQSGAALLSTWSFRLTRPPQPIMSARIGLALYMAVTKVWPQAPFSLKAPNDLYLGDKKVAGILLEAVEQGPHIRLLIGLGLNVYQAPAIETATFLTSSIDEASVGANWNFFLDELYRQFQQACDQVSQQLSSLDCEALLHALNESPLLKEKYSKVDSDGSLHTGSQVIHWWSL